MLPAKSPDFGKLSKAVALDQQRTMRASERVWKASCKRTTVAATELLHSTPLYRQDTYIHAVAGVVREVRGRAIVQRIHESGGRPESGRVGKGRGGV